MMRKGGQFIFGWIAFLLSCNARNHANTARSHSASNQNRICSHQIPKTSSQMFLSTAQTNASIVCFETVDCWSLLRVYSNRARNAHSYLASNISIIYDRTTNIKYLHCFSGAVSKNSVITISEMQIQRTSEPPNTIMNQLGQCRCELRKTCLRAT